MKVGTHHSAATKARLAAITRARMARAPLPTFWTEARTGVLIAMLGDGLSRAAIVRAIGHGCTYNMVVGKIHRLRRAGAL